MEASKKKISYKVISCPLPSCLSPQLAAGAPSIHHQPNQPYRNCFILTLFFFSFLSFPVVATTATAAAFSFLPPSSSSSSSFHPQILIILILGPYLTRPFLLLTAPPPSVHIPRLPHIPNPLFLSFTSKVLCLSTVLSSLSLAGNTHCQSSSSHSPSCPTLPSSPPRICICICSFPSLYQSSTCIQLYRPQYPQRPGFTLAHRPQFDLVFC
ncbi:hypothetical protein K456DRAFT_229506 [Colletotrichum gloeosporioides 23]|nr:hypothetical protein K456DRAFT_229506 [Colletotrichum gloeosporioides 23]